MEEKPFGIIYKATNKSNEKCYIGQTVRKLYKRICDHRCSARRNNDNSYFHNALRKYGTKHFKWEVLCECKTKEELDEMEFHYIKQYNSYSSKGYNLSFGGEGSVGRVFSKESKKRMSDLAKKRFRNSKEKHPRCGKHLSEETKKRIGKYHKGKKISDEMKKR